MPGPRRLPRRPRRLVDAAELLRRRRGRHPRGRAADRQGRARAGRALLDADRAPSRRRRAAARRAARPRPPTSAERAAAARGARSEPRRRAQGRPLARAPGLAALGRAGRGRARAPRPRRRPRSTSGPTSSTGCEEARPDVAFVALHGRGGEDGTVQELLELVGVPYTGSGPAACIRCMDKVVAKHAMRDAGIPTPDFYAFSADRVPGARRGQGAAGDRGAARVPDRGQARRPGLGARHQVRAHGRRRAGRARRRLLLRHAACCSSATSPGRDLAVSVLDGPDGPQALPVVEAIPLDERLLRLRGALRDRPHRLRVPGGAADAATARARRSSRSPSTGCSAAAASPAST